MFSGGSKIGSFRGPDVLSLIDGATEEGCVCGGVCVESSLTFSSFFSSVVCAGAGSVACAVDMIATEVMCK